MKNRRKTNLKEKGITLVALVVTIIVLLILAGVTINLALSNNGIIQRTKDASEMYAQAEQNDAKTLKQLKDDIKERTGKPGLSEEEIEKINKRIKDPDEELQEVPYEAKEITDDETSQAEKGRSVTVEGAYSGHWQDQVFFQSDVGAIGTNKLKWYVLSADEKGVNLVSEPTKKSVRFQDATGYNNGLYYLNELSTKLFANEEYGVTAERIHALNLTDIKNAAEQVNAKYKVTDNGTERDWSWDLDVVKVSDSDAYNNGNVGQKTYTKSNKKYPALYTADSNNEVVANNPMYDETPGSKITTESHLFNSASKLTVNYTFLDTTDNATTLTRLGKFGESNIGKNLFNDSGTPYWLGSRCVHVFYGYVDYDLRYVCSGRLYSVHMCGDGVYGDSCAFRVVVSVPGSRVNIEDNGTVTLKPKNS